MFHDRIAPFKPTVPQKTLAILQCLLALFCASACADPNAAVVADPNSHSNRSPDSGQDHPPDPSMSDAITIQSYCPGVSVPAERPADGTAFPAEMAAALRGIFESLQKAMDEKDAQAIREQVCSTREIMGKWQGVAEAPGVYRSTDATAIDAKKVAEIFAQRLKSEIFGREAWVTTGGSTQGGEMSEALRTPCAMIRAYLQASRFAPKPADGPTFAERAKAGLDWLVRVQRPNGVFAFPDLRDDAQAWLDACAAEGNDPAECRKALPRTFELALLGGQRLAQAGNPPGILVDGWFVDSDLLDPGGLQFDTGICGDTLVHGYEVLGDEAYLQAARMAGQWAVDEILVPNWNYNAFSAGLLARLAALDPEPPTDWKTAALEKARLGVLPGAMEDGRWFDPHNARIVYHQIIFKALVQLALVVDDSWLDSALRAAHLRNVDEFSKYGVSAMDDAIEAYVQAQQLEVPLDDGVLEMLISASVPNGVPDVLSVGFWLAAETE